MRLHRIRVEHVRGLSAADVHFAIDGVTVIEAPNESGKTSLFDAFDVLLKEKHSTTKQAVKELQPVGRDVASVVEAELTVAGTHLTVRKSFNRDRSTELTVHAPERRRLTGHEAHHELRRILEEGTDMVLFEALRFEQGRALDSLALADSEQLARQLDASAGGTGDAGDDALYERIVTTFERYFTPTGQEGRQLKDAAAELTAAEDHVTELAGTAAQLEEASARSDELLAERRRLERSLATLGPQLREHREQVTRLASLRATTEVADSQLRAARSERETAVAAAAARDELIGDIQETEGRLDERERVAATAQEAWQEQQARLERLAEAQRLAEQQEDVARTALQTAREAAELVRRRAELEDATQRRRRIDRELAGASTADAYLADHPLTVGQLERIRAAADEFRLVESRLGDAAPHVRVSVQRPLELLVDGVPRTLDAGAVLDHQVPEQLVVAVDGTVAIEVQAGSSLADRQADREHARRALSEACAEVGVADREEAEERARLREGHQRTLAERDAVIHRELGGRSREELDDTLHRLATQVDELEERLRTDDPQLTLVTDDVVERLADLETAEQRARDETADARSEHLALAAEVSRLRDIVTRAALHASHDRDELAAARHRLADARAARGDEQLRAAVASAEQECERADRAVHRLERELDEQQPEQVELLAANAEQRHERLQAQLAEVRDQEARVSALIEVRGGQGVGEALQAAQAELERRREALRSLQARAAAARELKQVFEEARNAAYAAYREPLRQRIVQAGRLVFGDDLDVELDEQLAVVSRTLGGVTLAFDRLSAGAREQLAILTALAAADLAGDEGVPLVLDDTLGYTDTSRLERLGAVLGRVRGPQVVVLTCVGSRFEAVGAAAIVRLGELTLQA